MRPADNRPITATEFARAMARFRPFEPNPHVAVAVSGGPDSMALAHLAAAWVRRYRGQLTALIVDHGLRPESKLEAQGAVRALRRHGIAAAILTWRGPKPKANRQAAARAARYRLLEAWCRKASVLHLLLAHHADDLAETLLLRLARGSGLDGLAAMASLAERDHVRLLRPLLGFAKSRVIATATRTGMKTVDDPSNRNEAFARVRIRQAMMALEIDALRLADTASHLARARRAIGEAVGDLLAKAVDVSRAPICRLDAARLMAAPEEIGLRALGRVLAAVGGASVGPRFDSLLDLYRDLPRIASGGGGRTLSGCAVRARRGQIEIAPEKGSQNLKDRPLGLPLWPGAFDVV